MSMHPRQASLVAKASELAEKTAAKQQAGDKKRSQGGPLLWKYTDPEGKDFYLEEKKTTVKSPFSGKSFSTRPERFTPAQVGQDMKQEKREEKTASDDADPWKA
jgi:hypothetical protein